MALRPTTAMCATRHPTSFPLPHSPSFGEVQKNHKELLLNVYRCVGTCSARGGLWNPVKVHCYVYSKKGLQQGQFLYGSLHWPRLSIFCSVKSEPYTPRRCFPPVTEHVGRPQLGHSITSSGRSICCFFWSPIILSSFLCYYTYSTILGNVGGKSV